MHDKARAFSAVMAALVAAIHVFVST